MKSTKVGCVAKCSDEGVGFYIDLSKAKCTNNCSAEGGKINAAKTECVLFCESDEYVKDEVNDDSCIPCYTLGARCIECSSTQCTKCSSGYIKSDGITCVNDCYTEDGNKLLNYD